MPEPVRLLQVSVHVCVTLEVEEAVKAASTVAVIVAWVFAVASVAAVAVVAATMSDPS